MSMRDLGEIYPGFSADMSACARKSAAAPGHGVRCDVPLCKATVQGRDAGMRAHKAVVHGIHP
jgi:hypothetical protein